MPSHSQKTCQSICAVRFLTLPFIKSHFPHVVAASYGEDCVLTAVHIARIVVRISPPSWLRLDLSIILWVVSEYIATLCSSAKKWSVFLMQVSFHLFDIYIYIYIYPPHPPHTYIYIYIYIYIIHNAITQGLYSCFKSSRFHSAVLSQSADTAVL